MSPGRPGRRPKRAMPKPTARGVLASVAALLLLLIGGFGKSVPVALLGAALAGFVAASAYISWMGVKGARVERDTTLRGQVGHPVPFYLKVNAPNARAGFLVAKDRNFGVHPTLVSTRGGFYEGSWLLMLTQRGRWNELRTAVASTMPAGMFITKREFVSKADVEIGPATYDVELPEVLTQVEWAGDRRSRPPKKGRGIDFLGIREYQHGDRLRHIHWRATARHDELLVREFEAEGRSTVLVALDTPAFPFPVLVPTETALPGFADIYSVTPANPSVALGDVLGERAVSVAASLSIAAIREGHVVYVLSGRGKLVRVRSREEAMSYWACVSFGPGAPVTRRLEAAPPRSTVALVGTPSFLPYVGEVPPEAALFLVGMALAEPPVTASFYVPPEGPVCFQQMEQPLSA